ncbi:copper amine oxidase N-terminal domain-containing protein [Cytobacillus depressus]|uniref:Copper amine oxidase N-terminal domain-containing protein n=1 Tax=Cytobacillus depressus TaxID=1602942 RepID=A0A6L3V6G6_9BACI|nr:copper amine oxidase N-terminal domain-containing protein [Cytobacillus depressus]KAB2334797.1 copper amine oxidase N-terminal domain-containing protein [Cytobacillus depressus]
MKKINVLATTVLIAGLVLSNHSVLANSQSKDIQNMSEEERAQEKDTSNFIKFSGVVKEIEKDTKATRILVENESDSLEMIFTITNDVLLLDNEKGEKFESAEIKKGTKINAYYDKNKPMTLIYPANVIPEIMIVHGQELGQVKVAKFNKQHVSLDNDLKLHISKETILENEKGDSISEEDLAEKELIVFYTISTRSIPAQTTPTKIIALEFTDENLLKVSQLIDKDHYFIGDTKMIPIRKVAAQLGYKVEWNKKQNSILLRKQTSTILLTIGKKDYGYNRSIGYFTDAPEMKNGKTYVSEELLERLLLK